MNNTKVEEKLTKKMGGSTNVQKKKQAQSQVLEIPDDYEKIFYLHPNDPDGPDFQRMPHPSLKHLEYACHSYPSHSQILPTQSTACRSVKLSPKDRGEWVKYGKILSCGTKEAWVFAKPHFAHLTGCRPFGDDLQFVPLAACLCWFKRWGALPQGHRVKAEEMD